MTPDAKSPDYTACLVPNRTDARYTATKRTAGATPAISNLTLLIGLWLARPIQCIDLLNAYKGHGTEKFGLHHRSFKWPDRVRVRCAADSGISRFDLQQNKADRAVPVSATERESKIAGRIVRKTLSNQGKIG
jgi:hypothetical protein